MIHVQLTGEFIKLAPVGSEKGSFDTDYEAGVTVAQLVSRLGVKEKGIRYSVMVNNLRKSEDHALSDSDTVLIIPLLAGG